jgi:hypothetical protein
VSLGRVLSVERVPRNPRILPCWKPRSKAVRIGALSVPAWAKAQDALFHGALLRGDCSVVHCSYVRECTDEKEEAPRDFEVQHKRGMVSWR